MAGTVLEVAAGSGRNTRAFLDAGIPILATRDEDATTQLPGSRDLFVAALSTHGYLHGATDKLRAGFAELLRVLEPGATIAITLGSINDERFGFGEASDEHTFAPGDGPEKGVPHAYFERDGVAEILRGFTIESLEEVEVDEIAGRWAHDEPETGMRHWFVVARKS